MKKVISLSEHCSNGVFGDVVGPEFESMGKKRERKNPKR